MRKKHNKSLGRKYFIRWEIKFYIKAASLKTSRSKVESSLCEEKSIRLVIEFKMRESKDWKMYN
jgi:hypothetical protein